MLLSVTYCFQSRGYSNKMILISWKLGDFKEDFSSCLMLEEGNVLLTTVGGCSAKGWLHPLILLNAGKADFVVLIDSPPGSHPRASRTTPQGQANQRHRWQQYHSLHSTSLKTPNTRPVCVRVRACKCVRICAVGGGKNGFFGCA